MNRKTVMCTNTSHSHSFPLLIVIFSLVHNKFPSHLISKFVITTSWGCHFIPERLILDHSTGTSLWSAFDIFVRKSQSNVTKYKMEIFKLFHESHKQRNGKLFRAGPKTFRCITSVSYSTVMRSDNSWCCKADILQTPIWSQKLDQCG